MGGLEGGLTHTTHTSQLLLSVPITMVKKGSSMQFGECR